MLFRSAPEEKQTTEEAPVEAEFTQQSAVMSADELWDAIVAHAAAIGPEYDQSAEMMLSNLCTIKNPKTGQLVCYRDHVDKLDAAKRDKLIRMIAREVPEHPLWEVTREQIG